MAVMKNTFKVLTQGNSTPGIGNFADCCQEGIMCANKAVGRHPFFRLLSDNIITYLPWFTLSLNGLFSPSCTQLNYKTFFIPCYPSNRYEIEDEEFSGLLI